jgi:hypothetical protein
MVGGQLPFFKQFLNNARKQDLARRHKQNMKFIQILFALKQLDPNVRRRIVNQQLNLPHKTVIKAPPAPRLAPSTMNPLRGTNPRKHSGRRHKVFLVPIKGNFDSIKQKYHSKKEKSLTNAERETMNIFLMSHNNLRPRLWKVLKEKVLNKLLSRTRSSPRP